MTPEDRPAVRYEDLELQPTDLHSRTYHLVDEALTTVEAHKKRETAPLFWVVAAILVLIASFMIAALIVAAPAAASRGGPESLDPATSPAFHGVPLERRALPATDTSWVGVSGAVAGRASWYCGNGSRCTRGYPAGGLYAAAGPALRVGDWRGRMVTVSYQGRSVRLRLIDWCACPQRAIDLYRAAFARLAPPSRGVINVTIRYGIPGGEKPKPFATLPPTDTD